MRLPITIVYLKIGETIIPYVKSVTWSSTSEQCRRTASV